jgi:hypothetical protein
MEKARKKIFIVENYSSAVPNYKLAFPMKMIIQNLNQLARQRVAGPPPTACSGQLVLKQRAG